MSIFTGKTPRQKMEQEVRKMAKDVFGKSRDAVAVERKLVAAEMQFKNSKKDTDAYKLLLRAYGSVETVEQGPAFGPKINKIYSTALQTGKVDEYTFGLIISLRLKLKDVDGAVDALEEAAKTGKASQNIYEDVFSACRKQTDSDALQRMKKVFEMADKDGANPQLRVSMRLKLIGEYLKAEELNAARRMFNEALQIVGSGSDRSRIYMRYINALMESEWAGSELPGLFELASKDRELISASDVTGKIILCELQKGNAHGAMKHIEELDKKQGGNQTYTLHAYGHDTWSALLRWHMEKPSNHVPPPLLHKAHDWLYDTLGSISWDKIDKKLIDSRMVAGVIHEMLEMGYEKAKGAYHKNNEMISAYEHGVRLFAAACSNGLANSGMAVYLMGWPGMPIHYMEGQRYMGDAEKIYELAKGAKIEDGSVRDKLREIYRYASKNESWSKDVHEEALRKLAALEGQR